MSRESKIVIPVPYEEYERARDLGKWRYKEEYKHSVTFDAFCQGYVRALIVLTQKTPEEIQEILEPVRKYGRN